MAKNKTAPTPISVADYIQTAADTDQKRSDSATLVTLMERVSGKPATMWGPSIIGFGSYHYKYESGHEGDAPLMGFSPRKAAFSLYVFTGLDEHQHLLEGLGKYKIGKACIYVKKLSDIDMNRLEELMRTTMDYLSTKYEVPN